MSAALLVGASIIILNINTLFAIKVDEPTEHDVKSLLEIYGKTSDFELFDNINQNFRQISGSKNEDIPIYGIHNLTNQDYLSTKTKLNFDQHHGNFNKSKKQKRIRLKNKNNGRIKISNENYFDVRQPDNEGQATILQDEGLSNGKAYNKFTQSLLGHYDNLNYNSGHKYVENFGFADAKVPNRKNKLSPEGLRSIKDIIQADDEALKLFYDRRNINPEKDLIVLNRFTLSEGRNRDQLSNIYEPDLFENGSSNFKQKNSIRADVKKGSKNVRINFSNNLGKSPGACIGRRCSKSNTPKRIRASSGRRRPNSRKVRPRRVILSS